jgi:tRNA-Thr(GGU) m(6)t(6)A37 methyltransferase TsaA
MNASTDATQFSVTPIGVIRTPFKDRADAPQQPGAGSGVEGVITLYPGKNYEQALDDLAGFDRIWILAWFHLNRAWKPKVRPPRGSALKRGVFATRSPHRPNPIALSLARLLSIKGRTLRVADTDLLDGTPILDLKPYLADIEAVPAARMGWLTPERGAAQYALDWQPRAIAQAEWLLENFAIDLRPRAERVLGRDPSPHPYRRIAALPSGAFELAIKSWRVRFRVEGPRVSIEAIGSGYSEAVVSKPGPKPLHDDAAQRAFHARWPE